MFRVRLAAFAVVVAAGAFPGTAGAETCLQRFSCTLHGECRFPCLDAVLGPKAPPASQASSRPAPAAVALDTESTASLPVADGPTKDVVPETARRERHRRAHADVRGTPKAGGLRLVAATGISSVGQLGGKQVSFGPPGSASQAAGRRLFARLGVRVDETPLDFDNAVDGVGSGDVAAAVFSGRDAQRAARLNRPDVHSLPVADATAAR